eukprot:scaffold15966_cov249-Amphora_coffeaeformis.AAC.3
MMTQVKPRSSSGSNKSSFVVVTLVLLVGVIGTLVWTSNGGGGGSVDSIPEQPRVRSQPAVAVAVETKPKQQLDETPHRYEMILARLSHPSSKNNDDDETTTGRVILETYDGWAPIGVSHFDALVADEFYDQCRIFRVVDDFVVQFGIHADPAVQAKWRHEVLKDDPVTQTNAYGTITYATSGKNTRTVQLFINTNRHGNRGLDNQGFAPIGKIVQGMEFIERINNEYKQLPDQGKIERQGNAYLDKEFPRLTYIEKVRSVR